MDIIKKNRGELKAYFVKNAIPTQMNFADFIDAVMNQKEDGIARPADGPLSIECQQKDSKTALHFYARFTDPKPAWILSLNSYVTPQADKQDGLTISDGEGRTRLFIDRDNERVGIKVVKPEAVLHVGGDLKVDTDIKAGGAVGIGTNNPKRLLHVHSDSGDWKTNDGNLAAEIHVSGKTAGISFNDRGSTDLRDESTKGGRWSLFSQDNVAQLYTPGAGVLLTLDANGNLKVAGRSATVASERLYTVRGIVHPEGKAEDGSVGFKSKKESTGLYDITFDPTFSTVPCVVATQIYGGRESSTLDNALIVEIKVDSVKIKTGKNDGKAEDRKFSFIAMGPR